MTKLLMPLMLLVVVIASTILPGLARGPSVQAAGPCDAQPTNLTDGLTRGVWDQINARRMANGYPSYTWSDDLSLSAAWMARDRASRLTTSATDADSLGRNAKARATDCGFSSSASVAETAGRMWATDPVAVFALWNGGDAIRMYWTVRNGAPPPDTGMYTVAALGRYHSSIEGSDYWVMDVGTTASVPPPPPPPPPPTPLPPTSTPVPFVPTATPTQVPTQTPIPTPTQIPTNQLNAEYDRQAVELINLERVQVGAAPLPIDNRLVTASHNHNAVMLAQQCFSHQCPGEPNLEQRVEAAGYYWYRVGEIDGLNQQTPRQAVDEWLAAPQHRDTMLRKDYWGHIGCAYAANDWAYVWTCDFAWDSGALPTLPATPEWTLCANEGGYCGYDLHRQVRYGANGTYAYKTQSGGVACTNAVFGDPIYGVQKQCHYGPSIVVLPPPPAPTATMVPTNTPRPISKCSPPWKPCR